MNFKKSAYAIRLRVTRLTHRWPFSTSLANARLACFLTGAKSPERRDARMGDVELIDEKGCDVGTGKHHCLNATARHVGLIA